MDDDEEEGNAKIKKKNIQQRNIQCEHIKNMCSIYNQTRINRCQCDCTIYMEKNRRKRRRKHRTAYSRDLDSHLVLISVLIDDGLFIWCKKNNDACWLLNHGNICAVHVETIALLSLARWNKEITNLWHLASIKMDIGPSYRRRFQQMQAVSVAVGFLFVHLVHFWFGNFSTFFFN